MTRFGKEVETTVLDDQGSTLDVIKSIANYDLKKAFKRYSIRVKVNNKKDETTEYLNFSEMIAEKRRAGLLVLRDPDPDTRPSFCVDYPKTDTDGSYFIIRTHTEIIV